MSHLKSLNDILQKYYKFTISLDGLQETISELLSITETDSDSLFEFVKQCHYWEKYLLETTSLLNVYLDQFQNKQDVIQATIDEAKKDIKNETENCKIFASKCKITETSPEKIKEAAEWLSKCNKRDISIFKIAISEMNSYAKFFKANSFNCMRKYSQARKHVFITQDI